jgi:hypothetical protein
MRAIVVLYVAYFAYFAVVAIADTVDKDINAMVKALSFSDLNSLKQVWYSAIINLCAPTLNFRLPATPISISSSALIQKIERGCILLPCERSPPL